MEVYAYDRRAIIASVSVSEPVTALIGILILAAALYRRAVVVVTPLAYRPSVAKLAPDY
jgi:hypothetical protein